MGYVNTYYCGSYENTIRDVLYRNNITPEKVYTRGAHVWCLFDTGNGHEAYVFLCSKDGTNCYYKEVSVSMGPTVDDMPISWIQYLDHSKGYTGQYCQRLMAKHNDHRYRIGDLVECCFDYPIAWEGRVQPANKPFLVLICHKPGTKAGQYYRLVEKVDGEYSVLNFVLKGTTFKQAQKKFMGNFERK